MPLFRGASSSPQDQFATEVIALVRGILGLKAKRLDDFALRIEGADGSRTIMNLHNIYADTRELEGDARAERLRRAVLGMVHPPSPADWREAAQLLMPAVRASSWTNALADAAFGKPLVPFVKVLCAIDFEHSMGFATVDDLAAWGVTDDEALRTASANLARMPCEVRRSGPTALVLSPDGYVSSWLAAPAVLARIAADISDKVIAVAATRDQLILIDAEHPEAAVRMLVPTLEHYQTAARQLSPVPYLVSEAGIEPWQPPAGHPAGPIVDRAARYLAGTEYAQQKAVLDERLGKAGEDVYVGKHTLMQRPDGSMWSWTPWVRQVTNGLLPQADVVNLVDTDHPEPGAQFSVRWDDAMRVAADALYEEAEYDPPRWRHRGWPDDETLALLRAHAVPLREMADPGADRN
ncbi:MAG: hypothetical protein J2P28_21915 [Actinobacteria bacterium]|nr:hypothetical protein [Actinomycetota bacterium]